MHSPDTASSQKLPSSYLLSCASIRGKMASSVQEAKNSTMVSLLEAGTQHLSSADQCCLLPARHKQFIF